MSFNRLLLVIKQTAFDAYTAQEQLARRLLGARCRTTTRGWGASRRATTRTCSRWNASRACWLERGAHTTSVMRDDVTPAHVAEADLVLALGGDGTTLIASHIMRGDTPSSASTPTAPPCLTSPPSTAPPNPSICDAAPATSARAPHRTSPPSSTTSSRDAPSPPPWPGCEPPSRGGARPRPQRRPHRAPISGRRVKVQRARRWRKSRGRRPLRAVSDEREQTPVVVSRSIERSSRVHGVGVDGGDAIGGG